MRTLRDRVWMFAAFVGIYIWSWLCPTKHTVQTESAWTWSGIDPAEELRYVPCGERSQCARLRVPMNWNDTASDDYVDIAVLRLPAKVPVTDPRYGGAIILNPGGPGLSGIRSGMTQAPFAQIIFDAAWQDGQSYVSASPTAQYHDIPAFDPRGINNTTPYFICHQSSSAEIEWALQGNDLILGGPETDALSVLARAEARGQGCHSSTIDHGTRAQIIDFMGTSNVVRDVVEIAERHGQWREKQVRDVVGDAYQRLKWRRGEEMINFGGLSYGSLLGATLATVQSHRVRRFLLDGVMDPEDYYSGRWDSNVADADSAFDRLFDQCAAAGPEGCSLWAGQTGHDTAKLLRSILDGINEHGPVAVPGNALYGPQIITLSDIKTLLWAAVMLPRVYWPVVSALLEPLRRRDGTAFASLKAQSHPIFQGLSGDVQSIEHLDPRDLATRTHLWTIRNPGSAVRCGDTSFRRNLTEFLAYWG